MAVAVGIDLGTTNSVIAATEAGKPTVIPNTEGSRTTPSVPAFPPEGGRPGGPAGPPAGDHESQGHDLFVEAVHRAALRRGRQRAERRVVRRGPRARRRRAGRDHGPGVRAGG